MTIRPVRGTVAAMLLAGSLGLAGCAAFSPVQTDVGYNPADGVPVSMGAVQIHNLLLVAKDATGPAVISASVVNPTGSTVDIGFKDAKSGATAKISVPAFTTQQISTPDQVQLSSISQPPGAMVPLEVTSVGGQSAVQVPVLSTQSYYQTLLPTTPATTTTPTAAG